MSIFDQNNPQENSEELLYQAIKEELKPILEKWDKKCGTDTKTMGGFTIQWDDPERTKLIKETSKIVLQFVWMKLGLKLPEYTRRMLDENFDIMELKK